MSVAAGIFIASAVALVWTYVAYPAALAMVARRLAGRRPGCQVAADALAETPSVTVIVPAYNEARGIVWRVDDIFDQEYPADRLEVIVGSDGSNDETVALVREMARARVRVLDLPRRGRAHVYNTAAREARGEILAFTDAHTRFAPGYLRRLVQAFRDPEVGLASGRLVYTNTGASDVARSAGWYWRYELLLRSLETRTGSTVGVTSACMAIRRSLVRPLGLGDDTDDGPPLDVILAGHRVVFVPDALAYDVAPESSSNELRHRALTTTKNLTALLDRPEILCVLRRPGTTAKVVSHRLLRYLTPLFLLAILGSNLLLLGQPLFRVAVALQGACYAGALIGFIGDRARRHVPLASTLFTFCLTSGGFLLGLWNVVRHRTVSYYEPIRDGG